MQVAEEIGSRAQKANIKAISWRVSKDIWQKFWNFARQEHNIQERYEATIEDSYFLSNHVCI